MNDSNWMIYGANGYTGELTAREAVRRGLHPVLAGRSRDQVERLARELDCPSRVFDLQSPDQIAREIKDMAVVAHCAGPFSATARPMMDACLKACAHYCDITGELEVIEAGAERDGRAREAGIAMMPAVGFDVVPSDCLAATVAEALPGASQLQLAFAGSGGWSPGTMKTMIESLPKGGRARVAGRITKVPAAWKDMEVPFASGPKRCVTIPWGDVASAYYSTAIPNIEVYTAVPPSQIKQMRRTRWLMPLAGISFVQKIMKGRVERSIKGPNEQGLRESRSSLWARAIHADGRRIDATLETAGGYPLTVLTTLAAVERLLAGLGPKGFATPSRAFGKEFILEAAPESKLILQQPVVAGVTR